MKHKFRYILFLLFFITQVFASSGKFIKTTDGIIVYPGHNIPGNASVVRLQVINNNIIRVTTASTPQLPDVTSLITTIDAIDNGRDQGIKVGNLVVTKIK